MPNADAADNTSLFGRFVEDMLQYGSFGSGWDLYSLSRLAQSNGALVLHWKVRCHDPIDVIADRSWFSVSRV